MKSRDLKTIHDLIATNYQKVDFGNGRFLHTFQPATTDTTYQFEANFEDVIVEGERYNIGFTEENGCKVVDLSCLSKSSILDKDFSYLYARNMSKQKHDENKGKNDSRVKYQSEDGYYWGRKYAWREFGLVLPRDAFESYLIDCVKHPIIECVVETEGYPKGEDSIAFKEDGLEKAIDELIETAVMVNNGPYFKSPLYFNNEKRFTIKGVPAITDKK
ncbi:hypothetical protein HV357_21720 [Enterobacter cloacae]|uniref:hypothetical protein n=1 Tax=Enterobacter cloacae TaxID=550 RepID=UPI0015FB4D39|nr:hypothetical protein [Enterobacter cloacae]MBA7853120.1 hypothetical protein [Enterobacter cloacae]MBD9067645.1 hypothetical protein [Enterobacter cloacae]HDC4440570.1 hypothetical protein [Enterobacter cloacae]HDC4666022.1 hypothetical protein [Enterobacter cloacae]